MKLNYFNSHTMPINYLPFSLFERVSTLFSSSCGAGFERERVTMKQRKKLRSSLLPSFVRSFVHSCTRSLVHSFNRALAHSLTRSIVRSFVRSLVRCLFVSRSRSVLGFRFDCFACACSRSLPVFLSRFPALSLAVVGRLVVSVCLRFRLLLVLVLLRFFSSPPVLEFPCRVCVCVCVCVCFCFFCSFFFFVFASFSRVITVRVDCAR